MKQTLFALLLMFSASSITYAYLSTQEKKTGQEQPNPPTPTTPNQPVSPLPRLANEVKIQVALLLDTSNSMDGLIDQAKSQLWKMVNKLADAKKQQKDITLEISLYEYGNSGLDRKIGHIRQVQPLKADLDGLSEKLFSLKTNGGEEYCGWVIQTSLDELPWSNSPEDLHLIIIAGNEPFDQGSVNFRTSCENATQKDIIVNTIYCGDYEEGKNTHWFDCAQIAKGKYLNIDTDLKVQHIPTPYDTTLLRLNQRLNDTYIGYGVSGNKMKERQVMQDENAKTYGSSNVAQRALAKSKSSYRNDDWDLVDAWVSDSTVISRVKKEDLPAHLKGKSTAQLTTEVARLRAERTTLQKEMAALQLQIDAYTTEERKRQNLGLTLDNVLIEALVEQATAKGFTF